MRTAALLLTLVCGALLAATMPALTHAALLDSNPEDGARLPIAPQRVSLTFSQPVQLEFSEVTVIGPDGSQWQAGEPDQDEAVVSVPLRPLGPAGEYTIGYPGAVCRQPPGAGFDQLHPHRVGAGERRPSSDRTGTHV